MELMQNIKDEFAKLRENPVTWAVTFFLGCVATFVVSQTMFALNVAVKEEHVQELRDQATNLNNEIARVKSENSDIRKERDEAGRKLVDMQSQYAQREAQSIAASKAPQTESATLRSQLAQRDADLSAAQGKINGLQQRVDASQEKISQLQGGGGPTPVPARTAANGFAAQAVGQSRWIKEGQRCSDPAWGWMLPGISVGEVMIFTSPHGNTSREQIIASDANDVTTVELSSVNGAGPKNWRYHFLDGTTVHITGPDEFTMRRCA